MRQVQRRWIITRATSRRVLPRWWLYILCGSFDDRGNTLNDTLEKLFPKVAWLVYRHTHRARSRCRKSSLSLSTLTQRVHAPANTWFLTRPLLKRGKTITMPFLVKKQFPNKRLMEKESHCAQIRTFAIYVTRRNKRQLYLVQNFLTRIIYDALWWDFFPSTTKWRLSAIWCTGEDVN